ncbi:MAG: DUF4293 domain-containing protein [Bacteroidia bacterium]|nr:DUF4293 domain-containing protein [Bacteroidia bacterium]
MIQRIQTLFLLLAALAFVLLFFTPLASLRVNSQDYVFTTSGIRSVAPVTNLGISTIPLLALHMILTAICLVTIFLYKKRPLQVKMCFLGLVLSLGLMALIFFHIISVQTNEIKYSWPLILPPLAIGFILLAYRGIRKDEKLVRSLDRIR